MKKKQYNTIELFAGCGGLLDGFKKSGRYNTLACVEWQAKQCEVLRNRLDKKYKYKDVNKFVLQFDIQRTDELLNGWNDEEYASSVGLKKLVGRKKVDIISGGPPCQAYSIAGRVQDKEDMKNDYRNYLFESYLEIVKYFKPRIIVFENVEGILTAKPDGFNIIEQIRKDFLDAGYYIVDDIRKKALIDFSEYGVPQKRKRVILVGLRIDEFKYPETLVNKFYESILPSYKEDMQTVRDSISNLPKLFPTEEFQVGRKKYSHTLSNGEITHHFSRFHSKRDIEIFRDLAYDIHTGENKYVSANALKELYTLKTGNTSNVHKYHVIRWDKPSNTIPAHLKKDGLRHIHPDFEQARTVTVREAARLQTFDDDYEFTGIMSKDFEMIGNAVSPKFAHKLSEAIIELLNIKEDAN